MKSSTLQISVVLTLHQGNIFATETIAENHNQSKRRVVEPSPSRCPTLVPKALEGLKKGGRKAVRVREPGSLL